MKAILHIGFPKTGTTTIQDFLEANRDALENQRILVPSYNRWESLPPNHFEHTGHLPLAYAVYDPAVPDPYMEYLLKLSRIKPSQRDTTTLSIPWQKLLEEIREKRDKIDTVLFTCEMLSFCTPEATGRLRTLLAGLFDEVQIIVYLRRQVESLLSAYSQIQKMGFAFPTFDSYLLLLPEVLETYYMNYSYFLRRWGENFGKKNVHVRIFHRAEMYKNDLLSDFSRTAGLDDSRLHRVEPSNASLPAEAVEFCRILNKTHGAFLPNGEPDVQRFTLSKALVDHYSKQGNRPYNLSRKQAESLVELYRDSNNAVAREFLGRERLFDEDCSQYPEEAPPSQLTVEHCVEIAAFLWGCCQSGENR